jgi:hypothetical protein
MALSCTSFFLLLCYDRVGTVVVVAEGAALASNHRLSLDCFLGSLACAFPCLEASSGMRSFRLGWRGRHATPFFFNCEPRAQRLCRWLKDSNTQKDFFVDLSTLPTTKATAA